MHRFRSRTGSRSPIKFNTHLHSTAPYRDRETDMLCARVYLLEAARRRRHPVNRDFYWQLLQWAGNARRRAANISPQRQQLALFP